VADPAVSIHVRSLQPGDLSVAARILARSFPDKFVPIFGQKAEQGLLIMLQTGHMRTSEALLAEVDGKPAGIALGRSPGSRPPSDLILMWRFGRAFGFWGTLRALFGLSLLPWASPGKDAFEVEALATDPDFRRRGVATALLQACEKIACDKGIGCLGLTVVQENAAAISLYRSFGFVPRKYVWMGFAKPLFGFSAVWTMEKKLKRI